MSKFQDLNGLEFPSLYLPETDTEDPEVTVLVPSLNEQITVAQFCSWCHEGFQRAGVIGEILLVDSSSDQTPEIAIAAGARVLRVPRRGLGHAYRDAIPFVRGKYVILGDADCTYDFREIDGFIKKLKHGSKFVMGSRFRGNMEKNAMPLHHKYFGSPLTTMLADLLFGLRITDLHCGMRGLTTESLKSLDLKSDGWEYASEMIVNAIRRDIPISEIPISFFGDMEGRESHVKRQGWTTPFKAGWKTVETLLTNAADFFLIPPGVSLSAIGSLMILLLSTGPLNWGDTKFTLNTMIVGLGIASTGFICLAFGIFSRCFYDQTGRKITKWKRILPFNRSVLISFSGFVLGISLLLNFLFQWSNNARKVDITLENTSHLAVVGITIALASISTLITSLLINALAKERETDAK